MSLYFGQLVDDIISAFQNEVEPNFDKFQKGKLVKVSFLFLH